jgi:hypothetical protein
MGIKQARLARREENGRYMEIAYKERGGADRTAARDILFARTPSNQRFGAKKQN